MGTVREGDVTDGDVFVAESDGSRWRVDGLEPSANHLELFEQLPEPGFSATELGELADTTEAQAIRIVQLERQLNDALNAPREPDADAARAALGQAFQAWRVAFVSLDVVRTGAPGPDLNPPMAVELVTRAMMVDALARVLDGAPLGLEAVARNQIATFLGDPEMAVVNSEINRLRNDANVPPGAPGRDLMEAQKELQQLQSELDQRSEARATMAAIIDPRGKFTRTDAAGNVTERDLREAPEVLARQLSLVDKVPSELVQRAYEAAGKLVANRLARR